MEAARVARPGDLPRVRELRKEASAEVAGRRGGPLLLAESRQPEPFVLPATADRCRAVVVGTLDGEVVGYGAARVDAVAGQYLGVVDELFVETGGRGVGVGEAMMGQLMAWCAAQGCRQMDGRALPGDREAKGFFERHGFTARLLVMHRQLPADQGVAAPSGPDG